MNNSAMTNGNLWTVKIVSRGQAGTVHYIEGIQSMKFDWEFGGHDIIALVWGPEASLWNRKYPWATGRRKEIMRRVADEVIKQKAQNCWADIDYEHTYIKIKKQDTST